MGVHVLLEGAVVLDLGVVGVVGFVGGLGDGVFVCRGIATGINAGVVLVGAVLVDVVEGV